MRQVWEVRRAFWGSVAAAAAACLLLLAAPPAGARPASPQRAADVQHELWIQLDLGGTVSRSPEGELCPDLYRYCYPEGTEVTLTAEPQSGKIVEWGGDCSGGGACSVTMDQARTVEAHFVAGPTTPLTIEVTGPGTVNGGGSRVIQAPYQSTVALTATPDPSSNVFVRWGGACSGSTSCAVDMTGGPQTVTARFSAFVDARALTVQLLGNGFDEAGEASVASSPSGIACPPTCTSYFLPTDSVDLSVDIADPATRFFGGWGGDCTSTTGGVCHVALSQFLSTVQATVTDTEAHGVSVSLAGAGSGTVSGAGISCPSTCTAAFASGTSEVTLTATPAGGSRFTGWSNACATTAVTCVLDTSADRAVVATFEPSPDTHTVSAAATAHGTYTLGGGVNAERCPPRCSVAYEDGTTETFLANPDPGWKLDGWKDPSPASCPRSGNGNCVLTITSDITLAANFTPLPGTLPRIVAPTDVDFGDVEISADDPVIIDVPISNHGPSTAGLPSDLIISGTSVTGAVGEFLIGPRDGQTSCQTVTAGSACVMRVVAKPTTALAIATLHIFSNADGGDRAITFTARGVAHPISQQAPAIELGAPIYQSTLTAQVGEWTHRGPLSSTLQWQRCPADGTVSGCVKVAEGTTSYSLAEDDIGSRIRVVEDVADANGSASRAGALTEPVADKRFPFHLTVDSPDLGFVSTVGTCFDDVSSLCQALVQPGFKLVGTSSCEQASCNASVRTGTTVTLSAIATTPTDGSKITFVGWGGDCAGSDPTCTVTVDAARDVTALFRKTPPPGVDDPSNYFNPPQLGDIRLCKGPDGKQTPSVRVIRQIKVGLGRVSSSCATQASAAENVSKATLKLLTDNTPRAGRASRATGDISRLIPAFQAGTINFSGFSLELLSDELGARFQIIKGAGNSVSVNGLIFKVTGADDIVIDRQTGLLASNNADIFIPIPLIGQTRRIYNGPVVWNLKLPGAGFLVDKLKEALQLLPGQKDVNLPAGLQLPSLPIDFSLNDGYFELSTRLAAPKFLSDATGLSPTAEVHLRLDDKGGLSFQGTRFTLGTPPATGLDKLVPTPDVASLGVPGVSIGVKYLDLEYREPATLIGKASLGFGQYGVDAGLSLQDGRLTSVQLDVHNTTTGLAPLGPGVFLTDIGGGFTNRSDMFEIDARLGVSAGLSSCPPVKVDAQGKLHLTPAPFFLQITSQVSLVCLPIGTAKVYAAYNGWDDPNTKISIDIDADYSIKIARLHGHIGGAVDGRGHFQLDASAGLSVFGYDLFGVAGIVSDYGIAGCINIPGPWDPGVGTRWPPLGTLFNPPAVVAYLVANARWTGCDFGVYRTVTHRALTRQADPSGARTVDLPATDEAVEVVVHTAEGNPNLSISGPGVNGQLTPPEEGINRQPGVVAMKVIPGQVSMFILDHIKKPGRYTITPAPGSPAITKIELARSLPKPKVTGKLRKVGDQYDLAYDVAPIAGQAVELLEDGPNSLQPLKTVKRGGKGTVRFLPADNPGTRRKVIARVKQDGFVRRTITLATFNGGPPKISKVGPIRLTRKGTKLAVSWRKARNATSYLVAVHLSDGRGYQVGAKRTSITVPHVTKAMTGQVAIVGVRGGRKGRAVSARLKAVRKKTAAKKK